MAEQETSDNYTVVGTGSTGSVIIWRLLDGGFTVHAAQAGPADTDPNIHGPQGWPMLLGATQDWSIMPTPQQHANDRSPLWPSGKVRAGSSSLNGMIYIRVHRSGHDDWAAQGCTGWDFYSVLLPFLIRIYDCTRDCPATIAGHAPADLHGPGQSHGCATRTCSPGATTWACRLTRSKPAARSAPRTRSSAGARPRRPRP